MFRTLAHLFTPRHTNNHRPKIIHPDGLFVLTAIALVFHLTFKQLIISTPLGSVLGYASSITPSQILTLINKERANAGLQLLTTNAQLSAAATAKAADMFAGQYWAHNSPSGTTPWVFFKNAGYRYVVAGENLARDFGDTSSMVNAWMASPTHKANILQGKYTETGIAVVDGNLQGVETTLVVQMFGAPTVATAQIPKESASSVKLAPAKAAVPTTQKAPQTLARNGVLSENVNFPRFSPLDVSRAVFLAVIFLLILVLAYDMIIARSKNLVRSVGKNLAHIALLGGVIIALVTTTGGSLL